MVPCRSRSNRSINEGAEDVRLKQLPAAASRIRTAGWLEQVSRHPIDSGELAIDGGRDRPPRVVSGARSALDRLRYSTTPSHTPLPEWGQQEEDGNEKLTTERPRPGHAGKDVRMLAGNRTVSAQQGIGNTAWSNPWPKNAAIERPPGGPAGGIVAAVRQSVVETKLLALRTISALVSVMSGACTRNAPPRKPASRGE